MNDIWDLIIAKLHIDDIMSLSQVSKYHYKRTVPVINSICIASTKHIIYTSRKWNFCTFCNMVTDTPCMLCTIWICPYHSPVHGLCTGCAFCEKCGYILSRDRTDVYPCRKCIKNCVYCNKELDLYMFETKENAVDYRNLCYVCADKGNYNLWLREYYNKCKGCKLSYVSPSPSQIAKFGQTDLCNMCVASKIKCACGNADTKMCLRCYASICVDHSEYVCDYIVCIDCKKLMTAMK